MSNLEKAKQIFNITPHWTDKANDVIEILCEYRMEELPEIVEHIREGVKKKLNLTIERI